MPIRVVNRLLLILRPRRPYIDWAKRVAGQVESARFDPPTSLSSAFLIPEDADPADVEAWLEENAAELFEFELGALASDQGAWPGTRDGKTFREWFDIEIRDMIVDLGEGKIEVEEL